MIYAFVAKGRVQDCVEASVAVWIRVLGTEEERGAGDGSYRDEDVEMDQWSLLEAAPEERSGQGKSEGNCHH